jgi:hypothetical protein
VARATTGGIPIGILCVAAGLGGVTLLRPHVALTMFSGIALAGLVSRSRKGTGFSGVLRIVLFGVLFVVGAFLAASTSQFFGVDSLNTETVNQTLANAEGRTSEAGSSFTPINVGGNPALFPIAAATVLYRPFPFEVSNPVAAATALEGVFLMWMTWTARRRLRSLFRSMRRYPFVAYCVGISITFIYAFSSFSNFGILARQRCQVLPFFLALLCLPEWNREGVISVEEAVKQRDEVPELPPEEAPDPYADVPVAPDPYAGTVKAPNASSPDPYRRFQLDWDPYARFRDD